MFQASMKEKLTALEASKSELEALIASASVEPPVLLHTGLSDVYREQVANLTTALRDPSSQAEATSIIRGLSSEIRLVPEDGTYAIGLVGELAGLLALGVSQNEQSRPDPLGSGADLLRSLSKQSGGLFVDRTVCLGFGLREDATIVTEQDCLVSFE